MKKLIAIASLVLCPLTLPANAAMSPHMEKTLIEVCKAGASNSLIKYNHTMKSYRINKQRIFPRLVCNGQNFHQFALSQGAEKTAKRINRYMVGTVTIKDIAMHYGDDQLLAVNY